MAASQGARAQETPPQAGEPDAPIVSDSQFEAELPKLDPEMDRPLEPLDTFDVEDEPATTPEGGLAPAAAPPDDPALSEPLAPIATFDVETPQAPDAVDDAEEVARIRYALVVEGLDAVGLAGRFRDLSALEDADGEATNGAMIAARAKED